MQHTQFPLFPKNILLCVSASIAAYKAIELASMLKKIGANIAVVMSEESKKFISPLSFEGILHTKVLHKDSESWVEHLDSSTNSKAKPLSCNHISYAKWADICLIAPASANTISKIAYGIADNLIVQTLLASNAPKILAPAMNTQMYQAAQTQNALKILESYHYHIIPPREALLACDTIGIGALASLEEIIFRMLRVGLCDTFYQGRDIIITGGGSKANIDSVRCISNHSSGIQASTLAICLYSLGANVTFISSSFPLTLPNEIQTISVESNDDYQKAIAQSIKPKDSKQNEPILLFMVAALADFVPIHTQESKIKKDSQTSLHLELVATQDILASLDSSNCIKIGFKAEDEGANALHNAQKMLLPKSKGGKGCSVVCLNRIAHKSKTNAQSPFGAIDNSFTLISKDKILDVPKDSKLHLSYVIASFVKDSLAPKSRNAR